MSVPALARDLAAAMAEWRIVDCHEHLVPESVRTGIPVDVFTLFSGYTRGDLMSAGMGSDLLHRLGDPSVSLDERWSFFEPYYERIRWTSYTRAARLALQRFCGIADFTRGTCRAATEALQAGNRAGLYQRVLADACGIRTAITQCGRTDLGGDPLLTPVMPLHIPVAGWPDLNRPFYAPEADIQELDGYVAAARDYVERVHAAGAVGLKIFAVDHEHGDRAAAEAFFADLKRHPDKRVPSVNGPCPVTNPVQRYVIREILPLAASQDMVVCVHAGYWGDYRSLNPSNLVPLVQAFPQVRFDLYHLGYPYVREAIMLGKSFANVFLNLGWTHIISQRFACDAMDEILDTVPVHKILAFGGDYSVPVEKVYGHLVMARENLAWVLAQRIGRGAMDREAALAVARLWFVDNAYSIYPLLCRDDAGVAR
jgi:predicted TIM-barrel fold metal-dependent hydrolase